MAEWTSEKAEEAARNIDDDTPFSPEIENALRGKTIRRALTPDQRDAAKRWIRGQRASLPVEVAAALFETSASVEMDKLKQLADYTKFHLGLYITLLAAIIAFLTSELGPPLGSVASLWFLGTVLFLAFAGGCGGMVGSNLPNHSSLTRFEATEFSKWVFKGSGRDWIWREHACFWTGMFIMLVGLGVFTHERWNTPRHDDIHRLLSELGDAIHSGDYRGAARLFAENGELHGDGPTAMRRDAIAARLAENRGGSRRPFVVTGLETRLIDTNHAVVSGRAEFAVLRSGQRDVEQEPFVAILFKRKAGWAIHVWSWGGPRPFFPPCSGADTVSSPSKGG